VRAGDATRARILDAARAEFAEYGIAGARVDRIAANARANKAQLYAYFGNKEGLFDAVFMGSLDDIVNAVPIDATDLPGYAVRLYNEYLENPELVRLATWSRLERTPSGNLVDNVEELDAAKLANISAAQSAGIVDPDLEPFDVLTTVIALSMTWSPASTTFAAGQDEDEATHERRRRVLAKLVARAFTTVPRRSSD
jgi:AcrR family transcriptional regulator